MISHELFSPIGLCIGVIIGVIIGVALFLYEIRKEKRDDTNCVNSAPKDNSQQPSELNQHAGGEYD